MQNQNPELELVRDALYARNIKQLGCFAFNQSSDRVLGVGAPMLPTLEQVLRDEVMPNCPPDPTAQHQQFPGMANLLVDYFRIAKDGHLERAAEFLASLRGPVFVEAVRAIGLVWDHWIPAPFMAAIETAAQSGSPDEREIAVWLLDWHHNKPKIEQELAAARNEVG